ncbi:fibrous sheath CABYR-binding protein [Moschus berezovskii]|uniref:fibrous sheath CABYR-binding protein n=1 Tax=Moschus berezovskii TaxID=68408 RepID=UPI00244529C5|nr:fibrous sheath CABYR-binding protein [Moschus berezovskii]
MEEKDESEQSISAGRQEIRKRRRPSQPMVDKSQQTEVTEKKKQLSIPQSSGPKAALSIGNIPGSKLNYECRRVSSQLQQTWIKRKRVQDMADKSLQTETIAEEKKEEIKLVCEAVVPEEKPAAVEVGPEFPESVQEVEVPPSRYSVQVKTDRSQQTSCTGDWTMMNFPQKDKLDKEQQTYFSESEIVAIGWPTSSFSKSKEGAQKRKSSGNIFVSEHSEFQPTTSSNEEIRRQSISRTSSTPPTKKDSPVPLEDEKDVPIEVQPPDAEEISAEEQLPLDETTAEGVPVEVQPPPAEEAPLEVQPSPTEEAPGDEAPGDEAPAKIEATSSEETLLKEPLIEVQLPAAEEAPIQETPELQLSPAVESPAEEAPEVQSPAAEEAPAEEAPEVQSPPADEALAEGAPAEVESPPAEEAPVGEPPEVRSPPAEEAPAEEAPGVQSPPPEEGPAEEAPGVQSPPPEEAPGEEAPAEAETQPAEEAPAEEALEVQPPPAEEATEEEASEVQSQPTDEDPTEEGLGFQSPPADKAPAEEAPEEVQSPPTEETPAEEAPAELQPPSTEETTPEMVSVEKQPSLTEEPFITPISLEETSAEVLLPPSEQIPADEALVENVSPVDQAPKEANVLVAKLESAISEDKPKSEEPLERDTVPKDSSATKNEGISFEIQGVIHIELE